MEGQLRLPLLNITIMEKKQTAVEWLEEKLKDNLKHIIINNDYVMMESLFEQAKEMELEQKAEIIKNIRSYGK